MWYFHSSTPKLSLQKNNRFLSSRQVLEVKSQSMYPGWGGSVLTYFASSVIKTRHSSCLQLKHSYLLPALTKKTSGKRLSKEKSLTIGKDHAAKSPKRRRQHRTCSVHSPIKTSGQTQVTQYWQPQISSAISQSENKGLHVHGRVSCGSEGRRI